MLTIPNPIRIPDIMRSRFMLETASELVAANEWRDKQVMILMRPQGESKWRTRFFASDAPGAGPMPLDTLCKDGTEGPLYLPLHPGAERFWRERGYLP